MAALSSHKPVLVEKPLAVNREQLEEIRSVYRAAKEADPAPFLMLGYNRSFALFTERLREFFANFAAPRSRYPIYG